MKLQVLDGLGVDEPPTVQHRAVPELTDWDRNTLSRFPSVIVEIEAVIDEDGIPVETNVVKSDDDEIAGAVVRAFQSWRFAPAMLDGKPVRCRIKQRVVLQSGTEFDNRNQAPHLFRQIL